MGSRKRPKKLTAEDIAQIEATKRECEKAYDREQNSLRCLIRYHTDPEFRRKRIEASGNCLKNRLKDPEYREKYNEYQRKKQKESRAKKRAEQAENGLNYT